MARTALLLCLLLSACGQTGPLYAPGTDPDTGAPVRDESDAPAADTPAAGAQDDPGPPPAP